MKKLLPFLILLLPSQVFAAGTYQVLLSRVGSGISSAANTWSVFGTMSGNWGGRTTPGWVSGEAGTISNFNCYSSVQPTGTTAWQISVWKNRATSTMTLFIPSGQNKASFSGTLSVAAGNDFNLGIYSSSSPPTSAISCYADFTPTTLNHTVIPWGQNQPSATAENWQTMVSILKAAVAQTNQGIAIPEAGILENLYTSTGGPGASGSEQEFIVLNDATTTLSTNKPISSSGATNNSTTTLSVNANDRLYQAILPSNTGGVTTNNGGWGMTFIPNQVGDFPFMAKEITQANGTAYLPISGLGFLNNTATTSEAVANQITDAMTMNSIYAYIPASVANNLTITFRDNGASTGLSCIITAGQTSCSSGIAVSVLAGDLIDTQAVAAGAITAGNLYVSYSASPPSTLPFFQIFEGIVQIIAGTIIIL